MRTVILFVFFSSAISYGQDTPAPPTISNKYANPAALGNSADTKGKKVIVVPNNQEISFEGMSIEGELKTPGEFYFQNRPEEKFDSLTKRRPNFKREMMRDAVVSQ